MDLTTLSFDEFWEWLMGHPNCILRAGTPDTILFDDEDFYWHLAGTGVEPRVVQVVRGKRLIGELLLEPGRITCVEGGQENMTENLFFSSYRRPLESAAPPISLSFPMATRRVGEPPVQFTDGKKEAAPSRTKGPPPSIWSSSAIQSRVSALPSTPVPSQPRVLARRWTEVRDHPAVDDSHPG